MTANPFVTVIVCTRNRSTSLARTLRSLVTASEQVADPWELLVVDNGSTDETPATIESFSGSLPVRRIDQPVPGLSNARNAGVQASTGDYVLWTDDDVIVDEQWLAQWFAAFHAHPQHALFGGRTEPLYEEPAQPWFQECEATLASLLAIRDYPEWSEITEVRVPFGLNYAIRGKEQRVSLYDPELGVAPGRRRGGEEVAVIRKILAEGGSGAWVWGATVYHCIPAERQTEDYIRTFYSALGYDRPYAGQRHGLVSRLKGLVKTLLAYTRFWLRFHFARKRNLAEAVPHLVALSRANGSIKNYLGL